MQNPDLPITSLCIVTERSKCPPNYTPITRCHDADIEPDLWRDGLFSRKINRYICFTKEFPIADSFNVIEDIKLLNERDNMIGGFVPVDKCVDNAAEKVFQKKVLCVKMSQRYFTNEAICDLIIMGRAKRAPQGYTYLGEVNGFIICVRYAPVPDARAGGNFYAASASNKQPAPLMPTPPPRPPSIHSNLALNDIENGFVHVNTTNGSGSSNQHYPNNNNNSSNNGGGGHHEYSHKHYNPLDGVPFQLNPVFAVSRQRSGVENDFVSIIHSYLYKRFYILNNQFKFSLPDEGHGNETKLFVV